MSTDTVKKDILRGGQFLVKETNCEDVFTLEDLNEEQRMMRESTKEFVDREPWAHWERFENKDYAFTEETMRKAGELGLLSVAVPESYGGMGMGFVLAQQMGGLMGQTGTQPFGGQPAQQPQAPPPMPTQVTYFYAVNGHQLGPVAFDKLKELFASRTINRDSLIWKQGMASWTALKEIEELKSFLGGNTPPPLPTA